MAGASFCSVDNPGERSARRGTDWPFSTLNTQFSPASKPVPRFTPGGGGFGPPERRDPALIADDLAGGKATEAHVAQAYGAAALARAHEILAQRAGAPPAAAE